MGSTIAIAGIAGLASALLSGMLTPGTVALAMLFLVAPMPLFIVGFGWHPLAAALAGLIGAILVDLTSGDRGAIAFASLLLAPAYGITAASERLFGADLRDFRRDGIALGQLALGAVLFVASVVTFSAIWIEPDYVQFTARLKEFVSTGLRVMGGPGSAINADPASFNRMVELMSAIMLPMSGLVIITTIVLSASLGVIIADRARRMNYPRPPFPQFRLPGGTLILFGAAVFLGLRDGYLGVFAEIVALGLALMLMLQGLAVLHTRLIGKEARGLMLAAAWAAILVFGLPALIFLVLGMADHIFDLRQPRKTD